MTVTTGLERRRARGYRVFGRAFDYLLHLRPVEWPIIGAHFAVGTLLAWSRSGVHWGTRGTLWAPFLGLLLWVVFLNGGTLAINSAIDRDEGDVAYLREPPPPPRYLFLFGSALMLFGVGAATALPAAYWQSYTIAALMSFAYSTPPLRLKSVAGLDWFINMWGFGALTAFAGWAATELPLGRVGQMVLLAFCPLFAALYPLTQLYQLDEDRRRGDATLAVVLGPRSSVILAIASAGLSFYLFLWAADLAESGPAGMLALTIAAAAWAAVLIPWLRHVESMPPPAHQRRMYAALGAWAVTDMAVLFAFR